MNFKASQVQKITNKLRNVRVRCVIAFMFSVREMLTFDVLLRCVDIMDRLMSADNEGL